MLRRGAYAFLRIPIDAFPDISQVQVKIIMKAPGMTPEEVETRVITPVELELLGIPRRRSCARWPSMRSPTSPSTSRMGPTSIGRASRWRSGWRRRRRSAAQRLRRPGADLHAAVRRIHVHDRGRQLSLEDRRRLLDWTIRPALRTIPGVADVNALGGLVRTFEVVPDSAALAAAGLGIADIKEAISATNRNDGAGRLSDGEKALVVRAEGAIRTPADLEQVVLRSENGKVLRIRDIASVGIGNLTRYGAVTKDGAEEAVEGLVLSLRGADASAIVKDVRERLETLKPACRRA